MSRQSTVIESAPPSVAPPAPDVVRVRAIADGSLAVEFADGRKGTFHMIPLLAYPAFEALRSPTYFQSVFVAHGTVCWPGGEDLSPETLAAHTVFAPR